MNCKVSKLRKEVVELLKNNNLDIVNLPVFLCGDCNPVAPLFTNLMFKNEIFKKVKFELPFVCLKCFSVWYKGINLSYKKYRNVLKDK